MKKINNIQTINKKLRPNPFNTYRDPQTGRWVVVSSDAAIKGDRLELVSRAA